MERNRKRKYTMRKSMIEELMLTLKIPQGNFNYSMIEDEISHIPTENLKEFYKQVMNSESFGNGMKAIIGTAEKFKSERTDNLLAGTREQAKAMYDKFYGQCCAMLDYTQQDRNKTPNDREFFLNMPYDKLKNRDGSMAYTKQELYVLNELGGGSWLIDVRFSVNSTTIVDRIEKIISNAKISKYEDTKQISNGKVMKMIAGIQK
jgi:hypothetical protein